MALDFLAGCAGGAAGVIVGHPLDTVKVRIQTQSPDNIKYRGTFHCLSTIAKQESISGLYKGIASPLCGVAAVNAVIFGVYGLLRPLVADAPGNNALWAHFAAGSISGSLQSFIASPMELVKTRMQLDESSAGTKKPNSLDVLKGIYRTEGGLFRGVMKGWCATVAREIPGFGAYFATYEALTRHGQVGTFEMMMAGGTAGVASWILCFPADVVKTRIQSDTVGKYSGAIDCIRKTYNTEGYKAFTRGLTSTVIRAFPTNAATFTVVTWIMRLAEEKQDDLQNSHQQLEYLLQEWDSARLQQKLFNYDILQMNVTQQRSYDYLSLASQCVVPQQSFSGYVNASAFFPDHGSSHQESSCNSSQNKKSSLGNAESEDTVTTKGFKSTPANVNTINTNSHPLSESRIESKSSDSNCDSDCQMPQISPIINSHSHTQQPCENEGKMKKSKSSESEQMIKDRNILTTHTTTKASSTTVLDNRDENSHGTSTFPPDLKAVDAGKVKDSCNETKSSNSQSQKGIGKDLNEESISSLVKAWMKDNWASFSICKCYGDHCVCYI